VKNPRKRSTRVHAEDGEDEKLWRHVVRAVQPLAGRDRLQPSVQLPEKPRVKTAAPRARPRPVAHVPVRPAVTPPSAPDLAPGAAPGLDRRTATRLRRGRLAIDARFDLHGHTLAAAHGALGRFLRAAQNRGARCALVITGKGRMGEGGVIRAALPGWLNDPGLRPIIVAFAQAQPRDGGAGAYYVYLRRVRDR
jgi:DNA-nicking Smr family endonuclease